MYTWDGVIVDGGGGPLCALDPLSALAANTNSKYNVKTC